MLILERPQFKWMVRLVAVITVLCFVWQDFLFAQGGVASWSQVKAAQKSNELAKQIEVPHDLAVTRASHPSASDELIINIEDAHTSLGAQKSISNILESLVKNYELGLVGVEGSVGRIDTAIVSAFPMEDVRKKAADVLLRETKISAGEFYKITSGDKVELYGIEELDLYKQNIAAYQSLLADKPAVEAEFVKLQKLLNVLEQKAFAPEVVEVNRNGILYQNGDIKFSDRWKEFEKIAAKAGVAFTGYPNLAKLVETSRLENEIDFRAADAERTLLIETLKTKLPKRAQDALILRTLQFKLGKISPAVFHVYLIELAKQASLDAPTFANLIHYTQYLALFEEIDLVRIFEEVEAMEAAVKEKLFRTDDERELNRVMKTVHVLSKFLSGMMSSSDDNFYLANTSLFDLDGIEAFLQRTAARYGVEMPAIDFDRLIGQMPKADAFYRSVRARNDALLGNLITRMRQKGQKVAALVSGGFHSEGLSSLMQQGKVSHIVLMPKFDAKDGERPYVTVITQKGSLIEKQARIEAQQEAILLVLGLAVLAGVKFEEAKTLYIDNYKAKAQPVATPVASADTASGVTTARADAPVSVDTQTHAVATMSFLPTDASHIWNLTRDQVIAFVNSISLARKATDVVTLAVQQGSRASAFDVHKEDTVRGLPPRILGSRLSGPALAALIQRNELLQAQTALQTAAQTLGSRIQAIDETLEDEQAEPRPVEAAIGADQLAVISRLFVTEYSSKLTRKTTRGDIRRAFDDRVEMLLREGAVLEDETRRTAAAAVLKELLDKQKRIFFSATKIQPKQRQEYLLKLIAEGGELTAKTAIRALNANPEFAAALKTEGKDSFTENQVRYDLAMIRRDKTAVAIKKVGRENVYFRAPVAPVVPSFPLAQRATDVAMVATELQQQAARPLPLVSDVVNKQVQPVAASTPRRVTPGLNRTRSGRAMLSMESLENRLAMDVGGLFADETAFKVSSNPLFDTLVESVAVAVSQQASETGPARLAQTVPSAPLGLSEASAVDAALNDLLDAEPFIKVATVPASELTGPNEAQITDVIERIDLVTFDPDGEGVGEPASTSIQVVTEDGEFLSRELIEETARVWSPRVGRQETDANYVQEFGADELVAIPVYVDEKPEEGGVAVFDQAGKRIVGFVEGNPDSLIPQVRNRIVHIGESVFPISTGEIEEPPVEPPVEEPPAPVPQSFEELVQGGGIKINRSGGDINSALIEINPARLKGFIDSNPELKAADPFNLRIVFKAKKTNDPAGPQTYTEVPVSEALQGTVYFTSLFDLPFGEVQVYAALRNAEAETSTADVPVGGPITVSSVDPLYAQVDRFIIELRERVRSDADVVALNRTLSAVLGGIHLLDPETLEPVQITNELRKQVQDAGFAVLRDDGTILTAEKVFNFTRDITDVFIEVGRTLARDFGVDASIANQGFSALRASIADARYLSQSNGILYDEFGRRRRAETVFAQLELDRARREVMMTGPVAAQKIGSLIVIPLHNGIDPAQGIILVYNDARFAEDLMIETAGEFLRFDFDGKPVVLRGDPNGESLQVRTSITAEGETFTVTVMGKGSDPCTGQPVSFPLKITVVVSEEQTFLEIDGNRFLIGKRGSADELYPSGGGGATCPLVSGGGGVLMTGQIVHPYTPPASERFVGFAFRGKGIDPTGRFPNDFEVTEPSEIPLHEQSLRLPTPDFMDRQRTTDFEVTFVYKSEKYFMTVAVIDPTTGQKVTLILKDFLNGEEDSPFVLRIGTADASLGQSKELYQFKDPQSGLEYLVIPMYVYRQPGPDEELHEGLLDADKSQVLVYRYNRATKSFEPVAAVAGNPNQIDEVGLVRDDIDARTQKAAPKKEHDVKIDAAKADVKQADGVERKKPFTGPKLMIPEVEPSRFEWLLPIAAFIATLGTYYFVIWAQRKVRAWHRQRRLLWEAEYTGMLGRAIQASSEKLKPKETQGARTSVWERVRRYSLHGFGLVLAGIAAYLAHRRLTPDEPVTVTAPSAQVAPLDTQKQDQTQKPPVELKSEPGFDELTRGLDELESLKKEIEAEAQQARSDDLLLNRLRVELEKKKKDWKFRIAAFATRFITAYNGKPRPVEEWDQYLEMPERQLGTIHVPAMREPLGKYRGYDPVAQGREPFAVKIKILPDGKAIEVERYARHQDVPEEARRSVVNSAENFVYADAFESDQTFIVRRAHAVVFADDARENILAVLDWVTDKAGNVPVEKLRVSPAGRRDVQEFELLSEFGFTFPAIVERVRIEADEYKTLSDYLAKRTELLQADPLHLLVDVEERKKGVYYAYYRGMDTKNPRRQGEFVLLKPDESGKVRIDKTRRASPTDIIVYLGSGAKPQDDIFTVYMLITIYPTINPSPGAAGGGLPPGEYMRIASAKRVSGWQKISDPMFPQWMERLETEGGSMEIHGNKPPAVSYGKEAYEAMELLRKKRTTELDEKLKASTNDDERSSLRAQIALLTGSAFWFEVDENGEMHIYASMKPMKDIYEPLIEAQKEIEKLIAQRDRHVQKLRELQSRIEQLWKELERMKGWVDARLFGQMVRVIELQRAIGVLIDEPSDAPGDIVLRNLERSFGRALRMIDGGHLDEALIFLLQARADVIRARDELEKAGDAEVQVFLESQALPLIDEMIQTLRERLRMRDAEKTLKAGSRTLELAMSAGSRVPLSELTAIFKAQYEAVQASLEPRLAQYAEQILYGLEHELPEGQDLDKKRGEKRKEVAKKDPKLYKKVAYTKLVALEAQLDASGAEGLENLKTAVQALLRSMHYEFSMYTVKISSCGFAPEPK